MAQATRERPRAAGDRAERRLATSRTARSAAGHCGGGAPAGCGHGPVPSAAEHAGVGISELPGLLLLDGLVWGVWATRLIYSAPAPDFRTSAGHCTVSQPTPRATAAPLTRSHHFIPCALPRCALHLMPYALHLMPYALHLMPYTLRLTPKSRLRCTPHTAQSVCAISRSHKWQFLAMHCSEFMWCLLPEV